MKVIKPKVEEIVNEDFKKCIEMAGRTCYKSEANMTDDSSEAFVERMIKSGHRAMLEHGTVYLTIPREEMDKRMYWPIILTNPYSRHVLARDFYYITTNYRVLVENDLLGMLEYVTKPSVHHKIRRTLRITCDFGVGRELIRHRVFSFAQESTRYCRYSDTDKYKSGLTFIIPSWCNIDEGIYTDMVMNLSPESAIKSIYMVESHADAIFLESMCSAERSYMSLTKCGCKPEEARQALPMATKTEIVMTGFMDDWAQFLDLRRDGTTGRPHPDMKEVAKTIGEILGIPEP